MVPGPLQSALAVEREPSHFSRELRREPAPLSLGGGDRANILVYILLSFFLAGCGHWCKITAEKDPALGERCIWGEQKFILQVLVLRLRLCSLWKAGF